MVFSELGAKTVRARQKSSKTWARTRCHSSVVTTLHARDHYPRDKRARQRPVLQVPNITCRMRSRFTLAAPSAVLCQMCRTRLASISGRVDTHLTIDAEYKGGVTNQKRFWQADFRMLEGIPIVLRMAGQGFERYRLITGVDLLNVATCSHAALYFRAVAEWSFPDEPSHVYSGRSLRRAWH
jgi:hypothetical protein